MSYLDVLEAKMCGDIGESEGGYIMDWERQR